MGMLISDYTRVIGAEVVCGSAVTLLDWNAAGPVEIVRTGFITTTSANTMATATSSLTIVADLYSKASAGAGWTFTSAGVGSMNTTDSTTVDVNGKGLYTNTSSEIFVKSGDKVLVRMTSDAATTAATGYAFIEFRDMPFTELARPTSAPGDGVSAAAGGIQSMTKV